MGLRDVTKIAFLACGISVVVKSVEFFGEIGLLVLDDSGIGAAILKFLDIMLPAALAMFFYVLHDNQKK